MLKEYQISNFKAFAGPETLPIKPITLIFGPNSSGKSSILQSLLMLKQTLADRENALSPLLFKGDLVDLGSYREFIHRHDAARLFSFRVTMPMPKNLDDPFEYHWIVGAYGEGNLSDLEESLEGFQTVAMDISFSHRQEKLSTEVSKIELFLGNNPMPVITYKQLPAPPETERRLHSLRVGSLNEKHEYWKSRWRTIDETDDSHVRAIIEKADGQDLLVLQVIEKFQKMTPEEQVEFREELRILKVEGKDTKPETTAQSTPRLSQEEKDRLLNLGGFELALEAYKIQTEDDVLGVHGFLPETLNGQDMSGIIISRDGHTRSLSVLVLTAARLFRRALESMLYIGPLRSYPERYFMFSGVSSAYVGKSGKFVPDILVGDNELLAKVNKLLESFDLDYELKLSSLSDQSSDIQDLFALRLYEKSTGVHVGMTDVGFGFSQVLPIIVQCLLSKQSMILIEQPELHLHPGLQAELGDLFITSALGESKNTLIIETHSEHVLLRIMRRMRETSDGTLPDGLPQVTPDDVCILYVQPREGSSSAIRHLELDAEGQLLDPWPGGFFEEGYRERFA